MEPRIRVSCLRFNFMLATPACGTAAYLSHPKQAAVSDSAQAKFCGNRPSSRRESADYCSYPETHVPRRGRVLLQVQRDALVVMGAATEQPKSATAGARSRSHEGG